MSERQMDAFHPDFVKTYMPKFIAEIRLESKQSKAGKAQSMYIDKIRETQPSRGTIFGITEKSISLSPKEMMTKRKEFHTYQKAIPSKGKKK